MNVNHVQWENDSLVFYFAKTKGDHFGDKSVDPWHVYSNLKNLELCPVIVLAKYLISHPDLLNRNFPLLPGNNQYDRSIKIFHRVIHDTKETFHILGVKDHSLGSHLCQKGATTLCLSGCTVSTPYGVYLLEGFMNHGPIKGLVHPLQKFW